jgi:hypothetical protein
MNMQPQRAANQIRRTLPLTMSNSCEEEANSSERLTAPEFLSDRLRAIFHKRDTAKSYRS